MADLLLYRTWWSYPSRLAGWYNLPYHLFNLGEGLAWCLLGGLVLRRYSRHRRSPLELVYALAFFTFGLTDFREAYALQSWLLWVKLINLVGLLRLRSLITRRYYPDSTTY